MAKQESVNAKDDLMSKMLPDMLKSSGNNVKNVIIYDLTTRFLPGVLAGVGAFVSKRLQQRAKRMCEDVLRKSPLSLTQEITGSIVIERNYKLSGETNDMFDAVLSMASDLPQARFVKRTAKGVFLVETNNAIDLAPGVFFKKLKFMEADGEIERMSIEVYSTNKNIVQLRDFLNDLEQAYLKNRGNQLGRQLYYFDELPVVPPMRPVAGGGKDNMTMAPDLSRAPPTLTFAMYALHTNKSLNNIYGTSVRHAKKRVDFFLANPTWYRDKGIPYTLGILLHGAPGCGKTSFIKGLAKDTGRHILNIKLGPYTTIQQINSLFYSPRINIVRDGVSASYDIPIEKRIIVMEDIDCLSDVVAERSTAAARSATIPNNNDPLNGQKLNLSVLLNILDGVLETPGRIVVMTSNEPWKLDSALVRPGRIDVSIEFEKCNADDMMDMVEGICGIKLHRADYAETLLERVWTPAEVTKVIFENIENPKQALELFKLPPKDNRNQRGCYKATTLEQLWEDEGDESKKNVDDENRCKTMKVDNAEAKPEAKPEAKLEAKPEAKLEAKLEAKPEAKLEAKLEAKPDAKIFKVIEPTLHTTPYPWGACEKQFLISDPSIFPPGYKDALQRCKAIDGDVQAGNIGMYTHLTQGDAVNDPAPYTGGSIWSAVQEDSSKPK